MALDRLMDLLAHRFLCFSCIFLRFSYSNVRQTKLASYLNLFGEFFETIAVTMDSTALLAMEQRRSSA